MAINKKKQSKPLKRSVITLAEFRSRHFHGMGFNTDMYYVGVANKIYPIVSNMIGDKTKFKDEGIRDLVLNLTCYLEDLVSQLGVWEAFVSLHKKKYGREMPFFDTDDEFYSREFPCEQAVRFLIWFTLNNYSEGTFLNPKNPFIAIMAMALTVVLTEAYDNAPDTVSRPGLMPEEKLGVPLIYQIRSQCFWLCTTCYLTRIRDIDAMSYQLDALASNYFRMESASSYLREAYISYNAKIGPLGITAQEWLAEILELSGEESEAQYIPLVRNLKSIPYSIYKYKEVRKDCAVLIALDGSEMDLSAFTMPGGEMPAGVSSGDSSIMSLVWFDGYWQLNGLAAQGVDPGVYQDARKNWIKNSEDIKRTFGIIFKHFKKKRIGVCAGYESYLDLFPGIDRKRFMAVPEDVRNCDNLLYFLNEDSSVSFLPDFGSCVKLRGNKFYDKKDAEENAICLILDHELASPEMRDYLIENRLVPDAALNSIESAKAGKVLFQDNIRFLNDYMERDTLVTYSKDMGLAEERKYNVNETDA